VRVLGHIDDRILERLMTAVQLEDGVAQFDSIRNAGGDGANQWFHVTLREGRNRIVRRLWESQGVVVSRLMRIRFGSIELPPRLRARTFMELPDDLMERMLNDVGLPSETKPAAAKTKLLADTAKKNRPVKSPRGSSPFRRGH